MGLLLSPRANFSLAWDFQQKGAPVGELFQFASGLYFRGKLAYARAFGRAPPGGFGALAIAPGRGLMSVDERITVEELRAMAQVPVAFEHDRHLPRQALSQHVPSTQKFEPHSLSAAHTAPFGFLPIVHLWSAVQ